MLRLRKCLLSDAPSWSVSPTVIIHAVCEIARKKCENVRFLAKKRSIGAKKCKNENGSKQLSGCIRYGRGETLLADMVRIGYTNCGENCIRSKRNI